MLKNPGYRAKIDIILVNLVEHYWGKKCYGEDRFKLTLTVHFSIIPSN